MNFQENFSAILYKYLNRDSSFTGRTIIWALALKSISRHPILGNGNVSYNLTTWTTTQAHNTFGRLSLKAFNEKTIIIKAIPNATKDVFEPAI